MSGLPTTTSATAPAIVEQLVIPRGMIVATEPYRLAVRLSDAFDEAEDLEDLVRVDEKGQLLCLQNAKTDTRRWQLGSQARYGLKHLPAVADVRAAHELIRRDLNTEPPIEHRVDLVCMMLDAQQLKASDAYIQFLAWKLGDCPDRRKTETHKRYQPWFSTATITRAIDDVLTTIRPEYGRPVPIADVLDVVGRHASELIGLDRSVVNLINTIVRLNRIVKATEHIPKPPTREWNDEEERDCPF